MLNSVLNITNSLMLSDLLICTAVSFILGIIGALIYMYHNTYNKSFVVTLAVLPAMVQAVIMLVNGNLGTGVAVLGAFGLVRFRSVPGGSREIGSIFFAMTIGLATSMGYLVYAAFFVMIMGLMTMILYLTKFGEQKEEEKELKITIPENLDYTGIFDDLFKNYTKKAYLVSVKTTNMGSLFELHYHVLLKNISLEKEFLDQLRCRNGNLTILCGKSSGAKFEL